MAQMDSLLVSLCYFVNRQNLNDDLQDDVGTAVGEDDDDYYLKSQCQCFDVDAVGLYGAAVGNCVDYFEFAGYVTQLLLLQLSLTVGTRFDCCLPKGLYCSMKKFK